MQTVRKYFISLIISCKIREKTALLLCTVNQVGTGHKLHFQPKHTARAKLAVINNKNVCDAAEVWCRQLGSVSYHLYYNIRSGKIQLCSVVPPTKSAQAILGWKWLWHGWGILQTVRKCFISLILSYKVRKKTSLLCCTATQVGTGKNFHFQPKNPARAKLAAINNKNGCGTAEV